MVWGPGRIAAGRRTSALVCGVDVLPTFAALAGAALPSGVELDGIDLSSVWKTGAVVSPREEVILFNNEDVIGVRTARWKYVAQSYYRSLSLALDRWGPELFDMSAPGQEEYSLSQTYPAETKDMQARLDRAKAKYAPFKKGMPPAIRRQQERLRAAE
jgi:arylsulfatase A